MSVRKANPDCKKCHGIHVDVYTRSYAPCPSCWPKENKHLPKAYSDKLKKASNATKEAEVKKLFKGKK